ncbi:MAG: Nif3-like dinuclear metal center hexameric protein [Treponema sp.]
MTLNELDEYFRSFLKIEDFPADPSMNGVQIANSSPDAKRIKKAAFAVDACEATALAAAAEGADLLFVHHGLFWGRSERITGHVYKRTAAFIKNDIALYACHIPLDANNPYGNNYGLASRLALTDIQPFGEWKNMKIGVKGALENPITIEELAARALASNEKPNHILAFGKKEIRSVGIISGGAGEEVTQAAAEGLDAYVTGELSHELFHLIKELEINVIAGGHYQTETVGVRLVMEKLRCETDIETVFIDFPTGM